MMDEDSDFDWDESDDDSEASEEFVRSSLTPTEIFFRDNLFAAVDPPPPPSVTQLLDTYCGNEDDPDNVTCGPYPMISINGSIERQKRLDANYTCSRRYTALHHAAKCGHEHIVRELVARGASIDIIDEVSLWKSIFEIISIIWVSRTFVHHCIMQF